MIIATILMYTLDYTVEELREGPLEANKAVEAIRQEPLPLHSDFEWVTMNLASSAEVRDFFCAAKLPLRLLE